MDQSEYDALLRDLIGGALRAAGKSPDVRVEEPYLVALTFLINANPVFSDAGVAALCDLVPTMETTDGAIELLEFCVHVLRPRALISAVTRVRDDARAELVSGHVPRAWNTARSCDRVLSALDEPWAGGDIYASFDSN